MHSLEGDILPGREGWTKGGTRRSEAYVCVCVCVCVLRVCVCVCVRVCVGGIEATVMAD